MTTPGGREEPASRARCSESSCSTPRADEAAAMVHHSSLLITHNYEYIYISKMLYLFPRGLHFKLQTLTLQITAEQMI